MSFITEILILMLAAWIGVEVISKVPQMLHTPLMSGTNAMHGVVVVGAILVLGAAAGGVVQTVCGIVAVGFGAANVVGGFVVTDRMLQMFRRRPEPPKGDRG